jgi:4-alpha-glucanotransferase
MNVLTDNVSFDKVLLQLFVAQQWDQIKSMADQSEPVNICNDD